MQDNNDKPWRARDLDELAWGIANGRSVRDIANVLLRSEDAVRRKAQELNLVESPSAAPGLNPFPKDVAAS